jgi:hypothetical protein
VVTSGGPTVVGSGIPDRNVRKNLQNLRPVCSKIISAQRLAGKKRAFSCEKTQPPASQRALDSSDSFDAEQIAALRCSQLQKPSSVQPGPEMKAQSSTATARGESWPVFVWGKSESMHSAPVPPACPLALVGLIAHTHRRPLNRARATPILPGPKDFCVLPFAGQSHG